MKGREPALSGPLSEATVMFTGALSKPRTKYEKIVEDAGGTIKKGVSKNLDILVTGKNATGHKVVKARKLGVKIGTENELQEYLR
jgi:DNA ligase (NAD+)